MQSTPKIMVFKLKEVLYTALFVILGILLILLFVFMFLPDKEKEEEAQTTYNPGTYTASLILNSVPMEVSVSVDENYIKSVDLVNAATEVSAMYPLIEPSLDDIESYLVSNQTLENIYFDADNEYTYSVLSEAVSNAVEKAKR
jgi:uncharacterized protein with FMN-binding domain